MPTTEVRRLLRPMLAAQMAVSDLPLFASDDWIWQQKIDGVRLLVDVEDGDVIGVNRRGLTPVDPSLARVFRGLEGRWAFDGEFFDGSFYIFDVPIALDRVNPQMPLEDRFDALDAVVEVLRARSDIIQPVRRYVTVAEKADLLEWVTTNNAEGIMVKDRHAAYQGGKRTGAWRKAKFVETCDCVILETYREGKRSCAVGAYDDRGELIDIGSVTMTDVDLARAEAGDVIEVRYLYCSDPERPRLYQPVFLRFREDREPRSCLTQQLKFSKKQVRS